METTTQASKLFGYFNIYRIIIALLLLGITMSQGSLGSSFRHSEIYQFTALAYLLLNIGIFAYYRSEQELGTRQLFVSLAIDILMLHALFYLGRGVDGGLSNLVIISVAAANIVIRGRTAMALSALATLLSLAVEIERNLQALSDVADIGRAGLLGSIYFATGYIVQNLSLRIRQSENLAQQQQLDILELQKLNHQIIQSMRTGIIVCGDDFHIKTLNNACFDLVGLKLGMPLPMEIRDRIELWRNNPDMRTTPFRCDDDYPLVQANFSLLRQETGSQTLIFIEDTRLMTQQAQQLKLASLGRLTASIAHEVRNPLGAISHATQLLNESESLEPADRKMTDIIERHCKRVNRIIENTLSLSRRVEPDTQEVPLGEWLETLINEYRQQRTDIRIKLELQNDQALARFDPNQIEQVLINLLDNGVRHGQQHDPEAALAVHLGQTETGEYAYIDVINAGPPISEEVQTHLFEPFFTTESSGTGLGLYLSKEMCEANQAQLDYMEGNEEGVCFRIRFAHPKRIV